MIISHAHLNFTDILVGDAAVHFSGRRFTFDGFAQLAYLYAADCAFPCSPGETVNLLATDSGNDLPGVAEFDGQTYVDVGDLNGPNQLTFTFEGQMKLPPATSRTRIITVPVRLKAIFYHGEIPFAFTAETFTAKGHAHVTLTRIDGNAWVVTDLLYTVP